MPAFTMLLSDDAIAEFRAIYKAETGKDITHEEAAEYAERVIRLVKIMVEQPERCWHQP